MPRRNELAKRTGGGGARSQGASSVPAASRSLDLHDWVLNWWEGGGGALGGLLRLATLPLELGFRMVSGVWGQMYDTGVMPLQRAPIPVISIGNITVGGSGKTPLSSWLLKGLQERGETPALVSGGYGEDEIHLHRRWAPEALVIAEEDRAYGAWKAARKGATVVILDDGFQHRRLARDLDIVLLASSTPRKVRLLPRGPFREPLSGLKRAGVVVLTQKGSEDTADALVLRIDPLLREAPVKVEFKARAWTDLEGNRASEPQGEYLAVAGIADPDSFSRILRDATGRPGDLLPFPDHHPYAWRDVQTVLDLAGSRTLVTTEKDAVRLAPFAKHLQAARVLCLGVDVVEGEERLWRHLEGVLGARRRHG